MNVEDKIKEIEEAEAMATGPKWYRHDAKRGPRIIGGDRPHPNPTADYQDWTATEQDDYSPVIGSTCDGDGPVDEFEVDLIILLRNNARAMLRLLRAYRAEILMHRSADGPDADYNVIGLAKLAETGAAEAAFVGEA